MSNSNNFPAKVVKLMDGASGGYETVVINRGRDDGITEGQHFIIYQLDEEILDPDTGESLGVLEIPKGEGVVMHAQEKMAVIRSNKFGETVVTKSNPHLGMLGIALGAETREQKGKIIPFKKVRQGDLAKPI